MFLRHVASDPDDASKNPITAVLACLYDEVLYKETGRYAHYLHYKEVEPALHEAFKEGFLYIAPNEDPDRHYRKPGALFGLCPERDYPVNLIEQFGAVYGYNTARSLADLKKPSND